MKIGFIGLGNMGAPMARNLAKAGHAVTGFDVTLNGKARCGISLLSLKPRLMPLPAKML